MAEPGYFKPRAAGCEARTPSIVLRGSPSCKKLDYDNDDDVTMIMMMTSLRLNNVVSDFLWPELIDEHLRASTKIRFEQKKRVDPISLTRKTF